MGMQATPRRVRQPAQGYDHRSPAVKRVATSYDSETFEEVRKLALQQKTSFAEQIRQLVEYGLEVLKDGEGRV